jgi:hypothetical protein
MGNHNGIAGTGALRHAVPQQRHQLAQELLQLHRPFAQDSITGEA